MNTQEHSAAYRSDMDGFEVAVDAGLVSRESDSRASYVQDEAFFRDLRRESDQRAIAHRREGKKSHEKRLTVLNTMERNELAEHGIPVNPHAEIKYFVDWKLGEVLRDALMGTGKYTESSVNMMLNRLSTSLVSYGTGASAQENIDEKLTLTVRHFRRFAEEYIPKPQLSPVEQADVTAPVEAPQVMQSPPSNIQEMTARLTQTVRINTAKRDERLRVERIQAENQRLKAAYERDVQNVVDALSAIAVATMTCSPRINGGDVLTVWQATNSPEKAKKLKEITRFLYEARKRGGVTPTYTPDYERITTKYIEPRNRINDLMSQLQADIDLISARG